jgi:hypothetical protein
VAYRGQLSIVEPGSPGAAGDPVPASVDVGDEALTIVPDRGDPVTLPYIDVDDVWDDDYTLRLTDFSGRRYDVSMLGKAYGQVLADITKRRDARLQHDLLLTGVNLQDTFPGTVFSGGQPTPCEIRLFEDLMVVVPERGLMWGVPFSFVEEVRFDDGLYQTHVRTDDGVEHIFGQLGKRSEELPQELRRLLDALAARTARTLSQLVGDVEPAVLSRLAAAMRDGRAVQRRAVEAISPVAWSRLEDAVVGTPDLRQAYDRLTSMCPPGWAALGVKAVLTQGGGSTAEEAEAGAAGEAPSDPAATASPDAPEEQGVPGIEEDETGRDRTILWFFTPLARDGRPANAVAQEITSEQGHATYVFRLMEPGDFAAAEAAGDGSLADAVGAAVARLNRALLTLNFRREPIYLPDEQIATGRYARYRAAMRRLDSLQSTRKAFLGRAIHNATWEQQLLDLLAKA